MNLSKLFIVLLLFSSSIFSQYYSKDKLTKLTDEHHEILISVFSENMQCLVEINPNQLLNSCSSSCSIELMSPDKIKKLEERVPAHVKTLFNSGLFDKKIINRLNNMEIQFYHSYPLLTFYACYLGRIAEKKAKFIPSENKSYKNNRADAFRHAYWNALMTKNISEDFAKLFSSIHEFGNDHYTFYDLNQNGREYYHKRSDGTMDLLNNHLGREIAKTSAGNLKDQVLKNLNEGKLYILNMKTQLVPSNTN